MKKMLLIRNDKLGDFMQAWPAFAMLKASNPSLRLTALVPSYTAPLAEICPYLDDVIIDSKKDDKADFNRLIHEIRRRNFDAIISFFSNTHNAKLAWKSGIKYRLAPATKVIQFLYNHRLTQRRSRSEKSEAEYNQDLVRAFLKKYNMPIIEPKPPYLVLDKSAVENQRVFLQETLGLSAKKKWLFVHSGSGGSATNLSLAQYAELIQGLLAVLDCQIVLTAGPGESEQAHELAQLVSDSRVVIYDKNKGLVDFAHSLACADLFIAGSTGPLHLSSAFNLPTVGFYPNSRSSQPRRWKPINDLDKHLAFCPPAGKETQMNLGLISIPLALTKIIPFIQRVWQVGN
ncbi:MULTISPECIES: glycosyltransferase family 9 protein [unclassified Pasteurella]|uniref:glycosyltransferase family 9 protein n=1 Tax=unclassified Pasteurella TaxID=2621516 RepID=UPI00107399B9|nr:glycosyltransferase family 9 protein [Pasteurella sp. 19428wF3_WM03]TFU53232.1 lipopolysaccharide heptosyltransferase family protein [Pasteurella sp. WM03]